MEVSMETSLSSPLPKQTQNQNTSQSQSPPQMLAQPKLPLQPYPVSPGRKRLSYDDTDMPLGHNNKENDQNQDLGKMNVDSTVAGSTDSQPSDMSKTGSSNETTLNVVSDMNSSAPVGVPPAAKKRKLSPASKEAKQQEKEAKDRQRLEEKAKKEEEKRIKEEEKKKREAERDQEKRIKEEEKKKREAEREEDRKRKEEKKRAKDEEKAAKEEERRKREEDKMKKERAQTRLNAFFVKPKITTEAPNETSPHASPKKSASDGLPVDPAPRTGNAVISDYQREFPEFFLQSHTTMAPHNRFERDSEALAHTRDQVDSYLKAAHAGACQPLAFRPSELFRMIPYKRRRGRQTASVKEILSQMQIASEQSESSEATRKLRDSLKNIPMKSLKFGEDVRPPYQGTYTRRLTEANTHKMMRNPFHRGLPDTNYDYDSEAEWEEPEEGEDLDSEEEDEGSEEGDDDMDGFLDDEEDQLIDGKRRLLVGDLEPVCTGLNWQDQGVDPELQAYRMETILPDITFPIDPFSTAYWQRPTREPGVRHGRSLFHIFTGDSVATQTSVSAHTAEGSVPAFGKPKKALPIDQLREFKQVVEGSDLTKTGLVEVLKKRFPKVSKEVLKDTLSNVATRIGQKEADKRWVCK